LHELPLLVFGEWVRNTAANSADTAFAVGAKLGSASEPGDIRFSYACHRTEADALVGLFTDSDFAGGNTASSGHFIMSSWAAR